MLGALIASGLFAVVGTALRGLIRPISWSLFSIVALFAAVNQFTPEAQPNSAGSTISGSTLATSPTESLSISQVETTPTNATPSSSIEPLPIPQAETDSEPETETVTEAVPGWQTLPEQLETTIAKALGEESVQPKPAVTIVSDVPASPIAQSSPVTRSPAAVTTPAPVSPSPIKGFW